MGLLCFVESQLCRRQRQQRRNPFGRLHTLLSARAARMLRDQLAQLLEVGRFFRVLVTFLPRAALRPIGNDQRVGPTFGRFDAQYRPQQRPV